MVSLSLSKVSKTFGHRTVLEDIALRASPGEFVVLVGASGSGKSTLLNIIAGLERPTSGTVLFDEIDVTALTPVERNIAMVLQSYGLYPTMTVEGNLSFPLRVRGMPRRAIQCRVDEVARMLQIQDLLRAKPAQLSGGERQRVAIGRALVRDPKIFLLDEPLSNLDVTLRTSMQLELKRLHEASAKTFIYVTHDAAEAMTLATSIAVLEGGRIVQFGEPTSIYDRPATRYVASLVGSPPMNLIEAELARESASVCLSVGNSVVKFPQLGGPAMAARRVLAGFRPESAQFDAAPACDALSGTVLRVQHTGADRYAIVQAYGRQITLRMPSSLTLGSGMTLSFWVDPSKWSLFCPATGERLIV